MQVPGLDLRPPSLFRQGCCHNERHFRELRGGSFTVYTSSKPSDIFPLYTHTLTPKCVHTRKQYQHLSSHVARGNCSNTQRAKRPMCYTIKFASTMNSRGPTHGSLGGNISRSRHTELRPERRGGSHTGL